MLAKPTFVSRFYTFVQNTLIAIRRYGENVHNLFKILKFRQKTYVKVEIIVFESHRNILSYY